MHSDTTSAQSSQAATEPAGVRDPLRDVAECYLQAGLCVLPALPAEKRPALAAWKEYQSRLPTSGELDGWFGWARGMCLVAGAVSGNLELIDFDHGGELFNAWKQCVRQRVPGLFERLVLERSQSGGRHVIYRCRERVDGNMKLAQRAIQTPDDRPRELFGKLHHPRHGRDGHFRVVLSLIETRGEGGLFLCAPTPGYELEQGRFEAIPVIAAEERHALLAAAWSLNEWTDPIHEPAPTNVDRRPGDDFNQRGDVRACLCRAGWVLVREGENEYWRRPGKPHGWSATLKNRVLYVFSSNAAPFEPNRGYSPFSVLALLEHGGDFGQAASALRRDGFGMATPDAADLSTFVAPPVEIEPERIQIFSAGELCAGFPQLRPPLLDGLLRIGETMNVISSPKVGKSWLVLDLALAVAIGRPWLGSVGVHRGSVLIVDNELHPETIAHRLLTVARAREDHSEDYGAGFQIASLRGKLKDLPSLRGFFQALEPDRYQLIILDAFYRFMPPNTDENDNGGMAALYNVIDAMASQLRCSFALVHHTSKGNQSGKSVTDVGAGAGSQSRATDTHLILRPHEEPGAVVLDAAVRSWPPAPPRCLRWKFPIWTPADDLDPAMLRSEKPKRSGDGKQSWTADEFAAAFVDDQPQPREAILARAAEDGIADWKGGKLLRQAEAKGLIHRWSSGRNRPSRYATVPQPEPDEGGEPR